MSPEYKVGQGQDVHSVETGREGPGMCREAKPGALAAAVREASLSNFTDTHNEVPATNNAEGFKTTEETVASGEMKASCVEGNDPEDGKSLFLQGKLEEAKEAWLKTLRSVSYIIDHYHDEENPVEAQAELDEVAAAKKSRFEDYLAIKKLTLSNLALVSVNLREFGDAVRFCEGVLSLDPANEKAVYRRSLSLFEQGKLKEAQDKLREYMVSVEPPAGVSAAIVFLAKQIEKSLGKKIRMDRAMMARSFLPPKKPSSFQRLGLLWSFGLGLTWGIFSTLKAHLGYLFNPIFYALRSRQEAPKTE